MDVVWLLILVFSLAAYIALVVAIFPRLFLRTGYTMSTPTDRGLKKIRETNGCTIVYEPKPNLRKYVKQYILSERNEKKVMICKINEDISYISYDVVVFGGNNAVCKVLNVKEAITNKGYTREVELPEEASYVTLVLNAVDKKRFTGKTVRPITKGQLALYTILTSIFAVIEIVVLKMCCSYLFGGVFRESFLMSGTSILITCIMALLAVGVNLLITILIVKAKSKMVEGEK